MWTVFGYIIRKRKEKKSTYPYLVRPVRPNRPNHPQLVVKHVAQFLRGSRGYASIRACIIDVAE